VSYETRPLAHVNEAIAGVLHGKAKARLVRFTLEKGRSFMTVPRVRLVSQSFECQWPIF